MKVQKQEYRNWEQPEAKKKSQNSVKFAIKPNMIKCMKRQQKKLKK